MITDDDLEKISQMMQTHIGVMAEDFQHRLSVVAEGYEGLSEKMDSNTKELKDEIEKSRVEYRSLYAGLDQKITGLDQKIDGVDQKIDGVEQRLDKKIDSLGQRLDKKIDGLGQRLDSKIDGVESVLITEIRDVGKKVEDHEIRIVALEEKPATMVATV